MLAAAALDPPEIPAAVAQRPRGVRALGRADDGRQDRRAVGLARALLDRIAPDPDASADVDARQRALAWVWGLAYVRRPRPGALQVELRDRSDRIARCGWAELYFDVSTSRPGWRRRWCRDRACPSCARRRAQRHRAALRAHLDARRADATSGRLLFVTLTQPKRPASRDDWPAVARARACRLQRHPVARVAWVRRVPLVLVPTWLRPEGPSAAVDRLLAAWARLRNRRPFRRAVQGTVRAVECTWSHGGGVTGWHAHLHCVVECQPDADIRAWTAIAAAWLECSRGSARCGASRDREGATLRAQDWQTLTESRVGQVAKYITKPWSLTARAARTFFAEMEHRRTVESTGTWRQYLASLPRAASACGVPQGRHVADLLAAAVRDDVFVFRWRIDEQGRARPVEYGAPADTCAVAYPMRARVAVALLLRAADAPSATVGGGAEHPQGFG